MLVIFVSLIYPLSFAVAKILSAVPLFTPRLPLSALETVAGENPVILLISLILVFTGIYLLLVFSLYLIYINCSTVLMVLFISFLIFV
jgi:hypothetical protein